MMNVQLTSWLLLSHAATHYRHAEVVTRTLDGRRDRRTYADITTRSHQLMHGLDALGVEAGEPVATLAWNSYRHLEAYFAIPCTGRVLHTLNIRLSLDELAYIIGHAQRRRDPRRSRLPAGGRAGRRSHAVRPPHRRARRPGPRLAAARAHLLRGAPR